MLKQQERFTIKGLVYIAIDRTSLVAINILMVSLIYDERAVAIYWEILDKKGSSNLEEQLGDREFCSVSRLFWFLCGNGVYTDSFFSKIVLKVFPGKYFTIL